MESTPAARPEAAYSGLAKTFHWLIAALVLSQFVVSYLMPGIGPRTVPGTLINLHFSLGVTIWMLMIVRWIHRLRHPVPMDAEIAPWERAGSHAIQMAFYAILLVSPLLGWASASAHRLPVGLFGLTLPALAAPKARWALTAGDVHRYAMWTLLVLICLHVAAALYHRFVRHDGVLRRMLPGRP